MSRQLNSFDRRNVLSFYLGPDGAFLFANQHLVRRAYRILRWPSEA